MSSRKPSGAKRRAEQKERVAKEKILLSKVPKLEAFRFKSLSTTTATTKPDVSSSATSLTSSDSEQAEVTPNVETESGSIIQAAVTLSGSQPETSHDREQLVDSEIAHTPSDDLIYGNDPAMWKKVIRNLSNI